MSNNQTVSTADVAEMFKALSNPHRVAIFQRLISCCVPGTEWSPDEGGSECVGDLGRDLGIAPSTVSHHIKELRRAGLIHVERQGRKIECRIKPATLDALSGFFVRP
jgi:DNA-binding transcriptional ArsR family regulator